MLLHGVEVWGKSILMSTWKELENVQKHFLTKFLQLKKQMTYTLLLTYRDMINSNWDHSYRKGWPSTSFRFKNVPYIDFLKSNGKHATKSRRHINLFFVGSNWIQGKCFGRWDATNHVLSRCIARFLSKWNNFATPMYHDIGEMSRLTLNTLCYICCTQLQNHILHRKLYHTHTQIHVGAHQHGLM